MDKRRLNDLGLLRRSRSTDGLVGTIVTRAILAIRTTTSSSRSSSSTTTSTTTSSTIAIGTRTSGGRGSSHGGGRGRHIHGIDGTKRIVVHRRRTRHRIGRCHGRGEHRNTASRAAAMSGDCGSKGHFGRVSETAHVAPEREPKRSRKDKRGEQMVRESKEEMKRDKKDG